MPELQMLLAAYVELNRLHAEPGQACHMLADSIVFIQRQIRYVLANPPPPARYELSLAGDEKNAQPRVGEPLTPETVSEYSRMMRDEEEK